MRELLKARDGIIALHTFDDTAASDKEIATQTQAASWRKPKPKARDYTWQTEY